MGDEGVVDVIGLLNLSGYSMLSNSTRGIGLIQFAYLLRLHHPVMVFHRKTIEDN